MNDTPKLVYSKSLKEVTWNSTLKTELDPEEIKAIKVKPGKDIVIFAGASIIVKNVSASLNFNLVKLRKFSNGNVLLCYQPK